MQENNKISEEYMDATSQVLSFIGKCPTSFHAVEQISSLLRENGFEELLEGKAWNIAPDGKYFVTRNMSSVIAFKTGNELDGYNFQITASHSDFPTFKVKENAQLEVKGKYTQLNTEGYGGMLCAQWLDRPLSVAGRLIVKSGERLETRLVNVDRDLLLIPGLAIHMNRQVNEGVAYNKQSDMLPLFAAQKSEEDAFKKLIAEEAGVDADDILGMDMFLYNRTAPSVWGAGGEFVSCPQLDDLQCAYTSLQGFLNGGNEQSVSVYACFDNEEVGSGTKQGAASTFMYDVLKRVNTGLGKSEEDYYRAVAGGFMLSCDNAHAVHPNHPEKTDSSNCVYLNEGIVIKSHAGQKYTSDGVSIAIFKDICRKAGVPVQFFANRSDVAGGSTLGNIAMTQVSVNCVDIGLAQLAMHSVYETAGVKDSLYMIKAVKEFYDTHIEMADSRSYILR